MRCRAFPIQSLQRSKRGCDGCDLPQRAFDKWDDAGEEASGKRRRL